MARYGVLWLLKSIAEMSQDSAILCFQQNFSILTDFCFLSFWRLPRSKLTVGVCQTGFFLVPNADYRQLVFASWTEPDTDRNSFELFTWTQTVNVDHRVNCWVQYVCKIRYGNNGGKSIFIRNYKDWKCTEPNITEHFNVWPNLYTFLNFTRP